MDRYDSARDARPAPRIAIFLQDLAGGGAERMMLHLAGGMAERGHAVDLVIARAQGAYLSEVPSNVRLIDLGGRRTMASVPALVGYLRQESPTALLSALVHVNIAAILAACAARRGLRVVVSERNTISIDAADAHPIAVRIAHRLVPWLYPRADGIVAVSTGVAEDLARYGGLPIERITVINNPVVTPDLVALARQAPEHPWLSTAGPPVVLSVGRLSAQKDFETLLEAMARVRRARPVRLIVLGEGDLRRQLEDRARRLELSESVDFPGFVGNPYGYMARASVYVLSSRWEGSPNALVEAMACGTPVVATDCRSGPAEILAGGRYGRLVPVGQPEVLARAILETLDKPLAAEELRRRAADFSLDRSVDAYLNVLLA